VDQHGLQTTGGTGISTFDVDTGDFTNRLVVTAHGLTVTPQCRRCRLEKNTTIVPRPATSIFLDADAVNQDADITTAWHRLRSALLADSGQHQHGRRTSDRPLLSARTKSLTQLRTNVGSQSTQRRRNCLTSRDDWQIFTAYKTAKDQHQRKIIQPAQPKR